MAQHQICLRQETTKIKQSCVQDHVCEDAPDPRPCGPALVCHSPAPPLRFSPPSSERQGRVGEHMYSMSPNALPKCFDFQPKHEDVSLPTNHPPSFRTEPGSKTCSFCECVEEPARAAVTLTSGGGQPGNSQAAPECRSNVLGWGGGARCSLRNFGSNPLHSLCSVRSLKRGMQGCKRERFPVWCPLPGPATSVSAFLPPVGLGSGFRWGLSSRHWNPKANVMGQRDKTRGRHGT